jgi:hypothetical protein
MGTDLSEWIAHPVGEQPEVEEWSAVADTFGGRVLRAENIDAVRVLFGTQQQPHSIGLQRVGRRLAAFDPPNSKWAISRRVEVEIGPTQVDRLADPHPMPEHHVSSS